jgi:cell division protein FtsL
MRPNELTEKEIKKLQKKFPKIKKRIPKKRLNKEEIQYRQAQRKAKCENVCIFLITIFFLGMAIVSIYLVYLTVTYQINW